MNILIVVPSLMRAGAETQAVDLANGLAANGHKVHLCSFESQLDQRNRLSNDVHFHHAPRRRKYDTFLISTIAGLIDRERIDIIQGILLFAVLIAWLSSKRSSRTPPVIAGVHTTINRSLKHELQDRILYRRLLRRLPAVLFVCNYQRDHWVRKYPELGPIAHVVHNGVDIARYQRESLLNPARQLRAELGIPSTAFVFSCIAGFRREKGHRLLISAFARLNAVSYLVLAGEGHERLSIEAMVREQGLSDRVRFLGMVSDVRPLIVASNATVLASTAVETFSIAMLESMALSVPLIASRIGGLPEAIIPNETGLLFPIGDVDALTSEMSSMIDSTADVQRMGRAAEQLIRTAYTLEKMIEGHERVLQEVVSTWRNTVVA